MKAMPWVLRIFHFEAKMSPVFLFAALRERGYSQELDVFGVNANGPNTKLKQKDRWNLWSLGSCCLA